MSRKDRLRFIAIQITAQSTGFGRTGFGRICSDPRSRSRFEVFNRLVKNRLTSEPWSHLRRAKVMGGGPSIYHCISRIVGGKVP